MDQPIDSNNCQSSPENPNQSSDKDLQPQEPTITSSKEASENGVVILSQTILQPENIQGTISNISDVDAGDSVTNMDLVPKKPTVETSTKSNESDFSPSVSIFRQDNAQENISNADDVDAIDCAKNKELLPSEPSADTSEKHNERDRISSNSCLNNEDIQEHKSNLNTVQTVVFATKMDVLPSEPAADTSENKKENDAISPDTIVKQEKQENLSNVDDACAMDSTVVSNHYENPSNIENSTQQINEPEVPKNASSLALLAQYDTDSDSDVAIVPDDPYKNRQIEIDSDSSSDVEFMNESRNTINLDSFHRDNILEEDDDDEEEGNIRPSRQPRVKGELTLEDLPPIQDLHVTVPEEECSELGKIHSIVEQLVLVNALPGTVPVDLQTVLFRDKGKQVLGEVFDVLGQVSDPLYCVRFNSNKEIKEKGIEVGQIVYVAPRTEHTQFVILSNLMKERGSDASWENDVEPPPRFIDYSDDEEERAARRPNRKRHSNHYYAARGSYTPRMTHNSGIRQPNHGQENYNLTGNSWHSNLYHASRVNQPQYGPPRPPFSPGVGYARPGFNHAPYQHPPPFNSGLVVNPYAVYPPPTPMMPRPMFMPNNFQTPPPPPPPPPM